MVNTVLVQYDITGMDQHKSYNLLIKMTSNSNYNNTKTLKPNYQTSIINHILEHKNSKKKKKTQIYTSEAGKFSLVARGSTSVSFPKLPALDAPLAPYKENRKSKLKLLYNE